MNLVQKVLNEIYDEKQRKKEIFKYMTYKKKDPK